MVKDFDKVARKLIAKIKKGKDQQLNSRKVILIKHGLRSSQRMTIDEEINTLIKGMDHDYKRIRGILVGYKEKKGDDLNNEEFDRRTQIADLLQESKGLL